MQLDREEIQEEQAATDERDAHEASGEERLDRGRGERRDRCADERVEPKRIRRGKDRNPMLRTGNAFIMGSDLRERLQIRRRPVERIAATRRMEGYASGAEHRLQRDNRR